VITRCETSPKPGRARLASVQIIEVSVTGVRSAALRVRRHNTPLWFTLFPMIHVAQPAFYDEVANRLRDVDLIVAEGVKSDAPENEPVTHLYERFRGRGGPEIVMQDIDYASLGPPVLNPDLTLTELDDRLSQHVPLPGRLLIYAAAPIAGPMPTWDSRT